MALNENRDGRLENRSLLWPGWDTIGVLRLWISPPPHCSTWTWVFRLVLGRGGSGIGSRHFHGNSLTWRCQSRLEKVACAWLIRASAYIHGEDHGSPVAGPSWSSLCRCLVYQRSRPYIYAAIDPENEGTGNSWKMLFWQQHCCRGDRQTDIYLQKKLVTSPHEMPQGCRLLQIAVSVIINLSTLSWGVAGRARRNLMTKRKSSVRYESLIAFFSPKPFFKDKRRKTKSGLWLQSTSVWGSNM